MRKVLVVILLFAIAPLALAKNDNKYKKQKSLPPGLQKKYEKTGELPSGWQKKLAAGKVLDPHLYEIGRQHPVDPETYSLKPEGGTELLKIEDRLIRIKKDTNEILEVFGIKSNLYIL